MKKTTWLHPDFGGLAKVKVAPPYCGILEKQSVFRFCENILLHSAEESFLAIWDPPLSKHPTRRPNDTTKVHTRLHETGIQGNIFFYFFFYNAFIDILGVVSSH